MKKEIQLLLQQSDAQLVQLAANGNSDAFLSLTLRHNPNLKIYLHCLIRNKLMEEDALQNTWLAVLHQWQKHSYSEQGKFKECLNTIAFREAMKELKRDRKYIYPDEENIFESPSLSVENENEQEKIHRMRLEEMERAVKVLDKGQQTIVKLRIIKRMSFKAISRKLHITIGAATSSFAKAKKNLIKSLRPKSRFPHFQ